MLTKEQFKAFLVKSGLSLAYIAKQTGIRRDTISYWVNDLRPVLDRHIRKINEFVEEYKSRWQTEEYLEDKIEKSTS